MESVPSCAASKLHFLQMRFFTVVEHKQIDENKKQYLRESFNFFLETWIFLQGIENTIQFEKM